MHKHDPLLIKKIPTKMYADNFAVAESEYVYECQKCGKKELQTVVNLDNLPDKEKV